MYNKAYNKYNFYNNHLYKKQYQTVISIQSYNNWSSTFSIKSIYLAIDLDYHHLISSIKKDWIINPETNYNFLSYILKRKDRNHFISLFLSDKLSIYQKLLLIEESVKYNNLEAFVILLISLTPYLIQDTTFLTFEYLIRELYHYPCFFIFFVKAYSDIAFQYMKKKPRSLFSISINNVISFY